MFLLCILKEMRKKKQAKRLMNHFASSICISFISRTSDINFRPFTAACKVDKCFIHFLICKVIIIAFLYYFHLNSFHHNNRLWSKDQLIPSISNCSKHFPFPLDSTWILHFERTVSTRLETIPASRHFTSRTTPHFLFAADMLKQLIYSFHIV